ncbi:MAG TPA: L,D-transpeptidase [Geobacteraceae bacterium]|nr:L,D-transpeptidase [Geobacteraceae bacterium]
MLRKILLILVSIIFVGILVYKPAAISLPGPSPTDAAREDLSRVEFPSQNAIPWAPRFIRPQDTLEALFGDDWTYVARFNRVDRRHVYPGMTIKAPRNMADFRNYCPLPAEYPPARNHAKYILVNLAEQWLGAYEYGKLKFSMPAASGMDGHNTPTGIFQVDARDKNHTSSLYKTEDQQEQYPMDNAIRFHIGPDNVSYWIHARDLPGKPASHGCIGVYDEAMQNRQYGIPANPVLLESEKLYAWAVGSLPCYQTRDDSSAEDDSDNGEESGDDSVDEVAEEGACSGGLELVTGGPIVEVVGENPHFKSPGFFSFLTRK